MLEVLTQCMVFMYKREGREVMYREETKGWEMEGILGRERKREEKERRQGKKKWDTRGACMRCVPFQISA